LVFLIATTIEAEASPRVEQGGIVATLSASDAINGGIIVADVTLPEKVRNRTSSVTGQYENEKFEFYAVGKRRFQAVFGVPFVHAAGSSSIVIHVGEGQKAIRLELTLDVREGDYISEQLKTDPKFVNPKKKDLLRIQREVKEIGKLYRVVTRKKHWKGLFKLPVESAITSRYGNKRIFNGAMQSYHQGLDLRAPTGTRISAPAGGRVVLAKDLFFTGNTVILDHGYGVFTVYAHLSKLGVKRGAQVKLGQRLGLSGMTGRASGPHLHWGAILHRTKVDPIFLTRVMK